MTYETKKEKVEDYCKDKPISEQLKQQFLQEIKTKDMKQKEKKEQREKMEREEEEEKRANENNQKQIDTTDNASKPVVEDDEKPDDREFMLSTDVRDEDDHSQESDFRKFLRELKSEEELLKKGYRELSVDHKLDIKEEKERVIESGLKVNSRGDYVVVKRTETIDTQLNMTRSIGDFAFKEPKNGSKVKGVTPEPDVNVYTRQDGDQFLFISCDGIWDKYDESEECINQIRKQLEPNEDEPEDTDVSKLEEARDRFEEELNFRPIIEDLMDEALSTDVFDPKMGSTDNMTCIFVWLGKN